MNSKEGLVKYAVAVFYISAILLANLTASTFIQFPMFGMTAVGTLFFGAVFTLRDYAHQNGRKFVYIMITVAAVVNVIAALMLNTPLRIVIASFISIIIAESVDTEVYQKLITRSWMVRVMSSNAVSIPVDTILFTSVAFVGVLSWDEFGALIYGDTVVKIIIGALLGLAYFNQYRQLS